MRIGFNLAANVLYVRIDGTVKRFPFLAADGIEQLPAREHAPGVTSQRRQQLKLSGGQVERSSRSRGGHPRDVKRQIADAETPAVWALAGSPQHGLHTCHELTRTKRLGDVVVGSDSKPGDAV